MPNFYERDPRSIEQQSFEIIREITDLSRFDFQQQQVAMRIVHSLGLPDVISGLRFSADACDAGIAALQRHCNILCDVEMVKQGVTKAMVVEEPLCFLNHPEIPQRAQQQDITRSMAALDFWSEHLEGSVVLIANAPTALYRLIEMLERDAAKPALLIAMPVGFVGAAESKQALWDCHQELNINCITLLGRVGGSAVTAAACNALLRCLHKETY